MICQNYENSVGDNLVSIAFNETMDVIKISGLKWILFLEN